MIITLKIIHMLCLFAAGASALGNAALARRIATLDGPPPPIVVETMTAFGKMGIGVTILLWVTGIPMTMMAWGGALGTAFYVKMVAATILLVLVPAMNIIRLNAISAGRPPPADQLKKMSIVAQISVVVAIVAAVMAFNG